MATNLHIDGKLLAKALKVGGKNTKRETVNAALQEFVSHREQLKILDLAGTLEDEDFWDLPVRSKQTLRTRRNGNGRK